MTRKDNLVALRDAVVAGDEIYPSSFPKMFKAVPRAIAAHNGDMNAALAFVAAVLPEFSIGIAVTPNEGSAFVYKDGKDISGAPEFAADTPARALLIAALNALIEMEG